jgi:Na+-transporting NADH:ubiquinone oxidoreductase subunit NqrB
MTTATLKKTIKMPIVFTDPRLFQICALSSFLIFGIIQLGWSDHLASYFLIISFSLVTQAAWMLGLRLKADTLKSGLITGLGLSLLFHSSNPLLWAAAPIIAISSKYLIQWKKRHIFNPANFGIIIPILLFGDSWISPGQWGSSAVLLFFFGSAAAMVLFKVGRIDTSLAFLGTLFLLEVLRNVVFLGWEWDVVTHKFTNGSLLLFAFFMITDPKTTPGGWLARMLWGVGIALLTFILTSKFYIHTAPMWALFFAAPVTAFLDNWFRGRHFSW